MKCVNLTGNLYLTTQYILYSRVKEKNCWKPLKAEKTRILAEMDKSEYFYSLSNIFFEIKNITQTKDIHHKCYGDGTPTISMVKKLCPEFPCDHRSTNDVECSECRIKSLQPEQF